MLALPKQDARSHFAQEFKWVLKIIFIVLLLPFVYLSLNQMFWFAVETGRFHKPVAFSNEEWIAAVGIMFIAIFVVLADLQKCCKDTS